MSSKSQKTRFLALALSLVLLSSLLPTPVWAAPQSPPAPNSSVSSDFFSRALSLDFGYQHSAWIDRITALSVNGIPYQHVASTLKLESGTYILLSSDGRITLPPTLKGTVLCTIQAEGYEDLYLLLDTEKQTVSVTPAPTPSTGKPEKELIHPSDEQVLHVRLVGSFEPALINQKGYDAISGATSAVTANKNSSVEVQCALVKKDVSPTDSDWQPLHKSGLTFRQDKSSIKISPQDSGMKGMYSTLDSSLTLSGTPAKEGTYQISVTVTDDQGREATSNSLPFLIYSGSEKLIDQLSLDQSKQAQDGKYLYDMVPWAIRTFGGESETVTVPAQIKAWFGSHTSGTYGKLGYALRNGLEPIQTLLIPAGCDLTLVNMDVLSSVRIVVQAGGKLTLQDSAIQGVVEVEKDGTFSMNYDSYHKKFVTGASINGQLQLKSGSVLENAAIYSNTNFIANGNEARKNTQPVAAVLGDVTLKGQVFLRGDEAPTGTDPRTGKSYAGQTALSVSGGTLTLTDGSLLAVYGGGMQASTSVGGDAIHLDNGTISGPGTLVAVGGDGTFDRGGDAVSGSGTISAAKAYLQGGASGFPKSADTTGGKAATTQVSAPDAAKNDGASYQNEGERPHIPRWSGASSIPSLDNARQLMDYVTQYAIPTPPEPAPPSQGKTHRPSRSILTRYAIQAENADSNGTVSLNTTRARAGSSVRVSVTPKQGYALDTLTVTDRNGKEIKLTHKSDHEYHFTMPNSPVSVQVHFVPEIRSTPPTPVLFLDVSQSDYFYPAIQWALEKNVTHGTSSSFFSPHTQCTRAQMVTFLWRAAGSPAPKRTDAFFQDVSSHAYYRDAVALAAEQGITSGVAPNLFGPDQVVTRAQTITLLHRAAGAPALETTATFSDVEDGSYYAAAAHWARRYDISQGTGEGRFSPHEVCTRAQIVSLLYQGVQQAVFLL